MGEKSRKKEEVGCWDREVLKILIKGKSLKDKSEDGVSEEKDYLEEKAKKKSEEKDYFFSKHELREALLKKVVEKKSYSEDIARKHSYPYVDRTIKVLEEKKMLDRKNILVHSKAKSLSDMSEEYVYRLKRSPATLEKLTDPRAPWNLHMKESFIESIMVSPFFKEVIKTHGLASCYYCLKKNVSFFEETGYFIHIFSQYLELPEVEKQYCKIGKEFEEYYCRSSIEIYESYLESGKYAKKIYHKNIPSQLDEIQVLSELLPSKTIPLMRKTIYDSILKILKEFLKQKRITEDDYEILKLNFYLQPFRIFNFFEDDYRLIWHMVSFVGRQFDKMPFSDYFSFVLSNKPFSCLEFYNKIFLLSESDIKKFEKREKLIAKYILKKQKNLEKSKKKLLSNYYHFNREVIDFISTALLYDIQEILTKGKQYTENYKPKYLILASKDKIERIDANYEGIEGHIGWDLIIEDTIKLIPSSYPELIETHPFLKV